jgi:enoyl-CoA hydratase/carnithine racemase
MPISSQVHGNAVVVTMRWVDKRNALSAEDADELAAAIGAAVQEPDALGLILTGE